jgi:ribonuclease HIII
MIKASPYLQPPRKADFIVMMTHTFKTTFTKPQQTSMQQQLSALNTPYSWQTLTEQYCLYRYDGQAPSQQGWVRIKQYTKGTFWVQAQTAEGLATLLNTLNLTNPDETPSSIASSSASSALIGNASPACPYMGCDESGKGDYFGPLVTAGVLIETAEQANQLKRLGVADSKTLNDAKIEALAHDILGIVGADAVGFVVLMPEAYNRTYTQYQQQKKNLNHLLAKMHARCVAGVLAKRTPPQEAVPLSVIVDQFGNERYLKESFSQQNITANAVTLIQQTKAERHLAVAAASIVARYKFVALMRELSAQWGVQIPLGANPIVLKVAKGFVAQQGREKLGLVAKLHFKTTLQV